MNMSLIYLVAFAAAMLVASVFSLPETVWAASFGKNTTESIQPPSDNIENVTSETTLANDTSATLPGSRSAAAPVKPSPPVVPPAAEPPISSVPQEPRADSGQTSNFASYENTSIGIKLEYPSNFEKLNFGNSIAFHTPMQPNEGLFSEQVGILTLDTLPIESESIEQFFRRQLDNFTSSFPDYTLSDGPTSINLDGNPALEAKFASSLVDNVKYTLMEIWTINQDKSRAYQIEISIRADKYSSFPPEHILRMINSIQLLDTNTVA